MEVDGGDTNCLDGLVVVEAAFDVSDLGMGMATALPGMLLADQGARVIRVRTEEQPLLDVGLEWRQVWDRDKEQVTLDPATSSGCAQLSELLEVADVAIVAGPGYVDSGRLAYERLADVNPGLVYARVATKSRMQGRDIDGFDLLLLAESGVLSNLRGHRPGPVFCSFPLPSYGTGLAITTALLAALAERETTGRGQRIDTSLADGLAAMLAMQVVEGEHLQKMMWNYTPRTKEEEANRSSSWQYPCADGEWIEIHPGAKGAYERINDLLEVETTSAWWDFRTDEARLRQREWTEAFTRKTRDTWLTEMWALDVPAQPVLDPGRALADEHVVATGLSVVRDGPDQSVHTVGRVVRVHSREQSSDEGAARQQGHQGPLSGVRVVDFGYFFAGPHGDMLIADLGAEVLKVEGVDGDPLRFTAESFVNCQRGKRSLALDLKSPEAARVLPRIFDWADVVHHNFRPGVAERLGFDEQSVRAVNPGVVYVETPAFGTAGPKASFPGFDPLIQAFVGVEKAAGGEGNGPMYVGTAPFDMGGGWLAAFGIALGVYLRRHTGLGQSIESTLLGAGLLGTSGVFLREGKPVLGPRVDAAQTGYGPAYRILRAADDAWVAIAVPDASTWGRLRTLPGLETLPPDYVGLRMHDDELASQVEERLELEFEGRPAVEWLAALREASVPCAAVAPHTDIPRVLNDPDALLASRAVSYDHAQYGTLRQIGFPYRLSTAELRVVRGAPALGEHTEEVLAELGFSRAEVGEFRDAGCVRAEEPA